MKAPKLFVAATAAVTMVFAAEAAKAAKVVEAGLSGVLGRVDAVTGAVPLPRTKATDTAVPKVRFGQVCLEKPATPEQIAEARAAFLDKKFSLDNVMLSVDEADEATLQCLLLAFPEVRSLSVWNTPLKSLDAVGACKGLVTLQLKEIELPDLAPLAGLEKLKRLELPQSTVRSLAALGALPSLEMIDLDDAAVDDFSALAKFPALETVEFSGTKVPPEKLETLGRLKQIRKFYGTPDAMTSLAWAKEIPQATVLHVGPGRIDDFTPISALTGLEQLQLWGLGKRAGSKPIGSLGFLKPCAKIQTLLLAQSDYTDFEVVGGLKELETLNLSGAARTVDLSVLRGLPKLRNLDLSDCEVTHFEALVGHPALQDLNLSGTKGVGSVKALVANKPLRNLTVAEGAFPAAELEAVKKALTSEGRDFSLNAW